MTAEKRALQAMLDKVEAKRCNTFEEIDRKGIDITELLKLKEALKNEQK